MIHAANTALDRIDLKILSLLQQEGRLSNVELAERVALSPTPCLRRVKRLEDEGVIAFYRAELDRRPRRISWPVWMQSTKS